MSVELAESPKQLLETAFVDALDRSSGSKEASSRIQNALNRRFFPYAQENWVIADQLFDPTYSNGFVRSRKDYFNATVGFVVCPDGRIAVLALGDPLVINVDRRLQGLPQTRRSTRDGSPVLDDPDLASSIETVIGRRIRQGKNPETVHALGPHINSMHPAEGCGAARGKLKSMGHFSELGMKYGGIQKYFEELDDEFYAFENNAKRAGGRATTIDLIHDAYSEGFIVGVRNNLGNFDYKESLRSNLLRLADQRLILMTELFEGIFHQEALDLAIRKGLIGHLDMKNPNHFMRNAMLIGDVAMEINLKQEKEGYPLIPDIIKNEKTDSAIRILGYHAVRSAVYMTLADRKPGHHDLVQHPEVLVSIGPTSALYNRENIPFVQKTPSGLFGRDDISNGVMLYNLAGDEMSSRGIDLNDEGRIIVVTGEYDETLYKDDDSAEAELNKIAAVVRNNAAHIREVISPAILTGEAIVLSCIHEPETRRLLAVA